MSKPTKKELEEQVLDHIAKISGRDKAQLAREQHLMADLAIDSPKALQLLMDLEEALAIEIPDDVAARIERVGDLLDYALEHGSA